MFYDSLVQNKMFYILLKKVTYFAAVLNLRVCDLASSV